MNVEIPKSLTAEHEQLHAELIKVTEAAGRTGEAAAAVAKLLHAHFTKETKIALPPLGLLPQLGAGQVTPEMEVAMALTERLKAELPAMLEEHDAIVGALEHLAAAARHEGRPEYAELAEKLKTHARTEEEVLYPAALLVGEYLKLRFGRKA